MLCQSMSVVQTIIDSEILDLAVLVDNRFTIVRTMTSSKYKRFSYTFFDKVTTF